MENNESQKNLKRILYIEDDQNSRLLLKSILEKKGYQITDTDDGLEGIDLAEKNMFDLVLLDINMMGMNGFEVATRIKSLEKYKNTPLIALTANLRKNNKISK